jgi:hypothetical protein
MILKGNNQMKGNIVEKSVWDKTYEPKVDRFMFEDEMYEYKKGGKTPKNPKEPKMEDPMSNLKYGVKVIETIGGRRNEIIVAMFKEIWERDAYLRERQEGLEERVIATRRELPNYDYQLIPINPY